MIRRILILGALALVLGVAARFFGAATTAPAIATSVAPAPEKEDKGDGRPRWRVLWTRPAPALAAMDIAGETVAWVDEKGAVRRLDTAGRTVWRTPPRPGVNRVAATPAGLVLAYSHLNPAQPAVRVLTGTTSAGLPVDGAVWDVEVSESGDRALIGTGARSLYLLPLSPKNSAAPQAKARWRTEGIPDSLAVSAGQPLAVAGMWQKTGVSAWSLDGTPRWWHEERDPTRLYSVTLSSNGSTAVAVSCCGPHEADARLDIWDADTGRQLWTAPLGGYRPRALVTDNGRYIAVAYVRKVTYGSTVNRERRVALYERATGRRLWEKGGLYFAPEMAALSGDGQRLTVTDGTSRLYTLDARGKIVSSQLLPANEKTGAVPTIRETAAGQDGKYLLIRRGDGQITLLKAT